MNLLDLMKESGFCPKRKAACHGGEYYSPCPFCKEGHDRFLVWPNRYSKNGNYYGGYFLCRRCGKNGNAIEFLRETLGLTYVQACRYLHIETKHEKAFQPTKNVINSITPSLLWQAKAKAFCDWSSAQLIKNSGALELLIKRGFTQDSIVRFKLGYNSENFYRQREEWGLKAELKDNGRCRKLWLPKGIVIPTFSNDSVIKLKIRRSEWKEKDELPKYVEISGSKQCPSIFGNPILPFALILESELDAILIQQFASDLVFCIALGGSTKCLDEETTQLLKASKKLLFCPDFDEAGASSWIRFEKLYPNMTRILTPCGKAPGDAFLEGVNLRKWIENYL